MLRGFYPDHAPMREGGDNSNLPFEETAAPKGKPVPRKETLRLPAVPSNSPSCTVPAPTFNKLSLSLKFMGESLSEIHGFCVDQFIPR